MRQTLTCCCGVGCADVNSTATDFACVAEGLVIDLDGGQHADRNKEDEARTLDLEALGFRVLRFWNDEVLRDLDSVVERVASELP